MKEKGKFPLGIGLIGCGAIGTMLAQAIDKGQAGNTCLIMVFDKNVEKAKALAHKLRNKPNVAGKFEELLECGDVELVVEAASQEAVRTYAFKVLEAGKDLMVMSVGALVDPELTSKISFAAKERGRKVYVPSGAIAGLDGVKASAMGKIEKVVLTTRKPVEALKDNTYFKDRFGGKIKEPTIIYEGPAMEACKLFPVNVNVAATLSLAGVGVEKTTVKVVADPTLKRNVHEIEVKGEFGELRIHVENVPTAENPKTSYLAALSAIATLKRITEPIVIGT
ncbi:MAG: aspartate dehydrogenase [Candidatus Bathyarchaeia archaeon]|nr:aspartate dehydrogenase [Candidatus Bathyarchaeota archaeon]